MPVPPNSGDQYLARRSRNHITSRSVFPSPSMGEGWVGVTANCRTHAPPTLTLPHKGGGLMQGLEGARGDKSSHAAKKRADSSPPTTRQ
jgi:hypothetical protein